MSDDKIKLLHLSDLHFSEGKDKSSSSHMHSIVHLQAIEKYVKKNNNFDRVLISGDLTNYGDRESFLTAETWIFGKLHIGDGETTGLGINKERIKIIPGNHDAFNNGRIGSIPNIKQASLKNYNFVFKEYQMKYPNYSYYDWIEKNDLCVFMAYVDSCHLGDTEIEKSDSQFKLFEKIARGKITIRQSENLLGWFDKGSRGLLPINLNDTTQLISKEKFATSLKILVMHHYVFEPADDKNDFFMSLTHRDIAFRNIAMSDFDILLCGHKHVHDFHTRSFGDLFDEGASYRFMLNYFRRLLGIDSIPIQYVDENGKYLTRLVTQFINFIYLKLKNSKNNLTTITEPELVQLFDSFLENPESIEMELKKYILNYQFKGKSILTNQEITEIKKFINTHLSPNKRKEIKNTLSGFNKVIKEFKKRPFLQIMSGSSSKAIGLISKKRSFNEYTITKLRNGYRIESCRNIWDDSIKDFTPCSLAQEQSFKTDSKGRESSKKYFLSKLAITLDEA